MRRRVRDAACVLLIASAIGAAQETGAAVYYSDHFVGRPVANGEIYSHDKLTAAHNGYPFGTQVRVTNLSNNQSVVVKINDRMRKNSKMLIDLSRSAARELGFVNEGKTQVRVEPVEADSAEPENAKPEPAPED